METVDAWRLVRRLDTARLGDWYEAEPAHRPGALHPYRDACPERVDLLLLPPRVAPESVRAYTREARRLGEVGRRHIAEVIHDGALPDGRCFVVMTAAGGAPLSRLLPLPAARCFDVLAGVARALAAAHAEGIVHRSMCPEIVAVAARDGRDHAVVQDFGTAHLAAYLVGALGMHGSPQHFAPELVSFRGHPFTPAVDVHAVGVIAFELFCGARPYQGATLLEILDAVRRPPPRPFDVARAHGRAMPPRLEDAILAALDRDPGLRPTMTELAAELEACR